MEKTNDEEMKKTIDGMDYQSMLSLWRFAPVGHPMFQGEIGKYFANSMKEKCSQLAAGEQARISKEIGWK